LENFVFCIRYFSKIKSNPAKKFSQQCFLGKTKPTCQNSAIYKTFQKWPQNEGDVLARGPSIVSPISNEASAVVQSHGSEPVAVFTLWSSLSGADIEEFHESSYSPFLVEQLHHVTPQRHTAPNRSVLYKPEKVNAVITVKMSTDCVCKIPSPQLLLPAPDYFFSGAPDKCLSIFSQDYIAILTYLNLKCCRVHCECHCVVGHLFCFNT